MFSSRFLSNEASGMVMLRERLVPKVARRWSVLVALAVAFTAMGGSAIAQQQHQQQRQQPRNGFQQRVFTDETGNHKYTVYVPAGYTPAKKWPVILFLHGAGERGTDGALPAGIGLGPLVKAREANFPFIVVFPQMEDARGRILTGWAPNSLDGKRALA